MKLDYNLIGYYFYNNINMKKILISMLLIFSIISANATYTSTSNWYNTPILDESLDFEAKLDWWKVYTSWTAYSQDESLKYYKVVRSQDTTNPVYPDNWYIYYSSDINSTSYVDQKPLTGTTYYRVCAITNENNRYCSNVVTIYKEKTEEVKIWWEKDAYWCYTSAWYSWCEAKSKCIRTWEEKCEQTNNSDMTKKIVENNLKVKAEKLVNNFVLKVEKAYSSTDKRIEVINKVIVKLNALAENKPSQKQIIEYIVIKLKAKVESYKWSDLGDIESIFSDIE